MNSGKERSETDVADLLQFMRPGKSIEEPPIFSAAMLRKFGRNRWNSGDLSQAFAFRSAREREWSGSQS